MDSLVLLLLICVAASLVAGDELAAPKMTEMKADDCKEENGECQNPEKVRIITVDELAQYDGTREDGEIWLSIVGEVYNVTNGAEYYAAGSGYHYFAGTDGSVPFITGKFDHGEGSKSTDVLKPGEVHALLQWREFYEKEEKYPFLGYLLGRFYDEDGNPAEELINLRKKASEYREPAPRRRKKPKKS